MRPKKRGGAKSKNLANTDTIDYFSHPVTKYIIRSNLKDENLLGMVVSLCYHFQS